ncbi:MAG TPA: hypothetical protein PKC39_10445 [Ferruginibacter sp.]|nr:hypothetical protein [Ferruginibacter sp.]HMP21369.1 hypothetical protein [Ferruginibacter sp.]
MSSFAAMPAKLYKSRVTIAVIAASILLLSGCKKPTVSDISITTLQAYFETNILNRNFVVDLAKDGTTDLTGNYSGYTFLLTKTTSYYEGPMTGTKGGMVYTGTWSSNEDYSKLVIILNSPSVPDEFIFLNRNWRFTKKDLPVMQLAPWGTTDPKVLHMRRL